MSADADVGTDTPGVTDADRERLAVIRERNTDIDAATCAAWRRHAHDGAAPAEIADRDDETRPVPSIRRHASGRCNHDLDVAPAPLDNRSGGPHLSLAECARIRALDAEGWTCPDIVDDVDRSPASVYRHANGRCSHDHGDREDGDSS